MYGSLSATLPAITLKLLPEIYAMVNLPTAAEIPLWALAQHNDHFSAVTRNEFGLSIVVPERLLPVGHDYPGQAVPWRIIRIEEPRSMGVSGLYAALTKPLADDAISIYIIGAYNADHILVRERDTARAVQILSRFASVR